MYVCMYVCMHVCMYVFMYYEKKNIESTIMKLKLISHK